MPTSGVHVFTLDLDQPPRVVERLDRLLPAAERDAAAARRVARAATRVVLAEALDIHPVDLVISRECVHCGHPGHGRPTVAGNDGVSFSLSHSGAFAVIALATGGTRVGVDVEEIRDRTRIDALAARVLSEDEYDSWRVIDDDHERVRTFLVAWTAKEAYLKALGIGITTRLRDVSPVVAGWTNRPLDLGPHHVGALAADADGFEIRYSALSPLTMTSGGTAR